MFLIDPSLSLCSYFFFLIALSFSGVKSLVFAKSGSILYSAGVDGMVCEMNVDSGELLEKFRASKRAVTCICVSRGKFYNVLSGCC